MTINELLAAVTTKSPPCICIDSRLIKAGDIFVALKGTTFDGHDFVDQAVANGAKYIVSQKTEATKARITSHDTIVVDNSAKAAASLAQAGKGHPASK